MRPTPTLEPTLEPTRLYTPTLPLQRRQLGRLAAGLSMAALAGAFSLSVQAQDAAFDHQYLRWNALLKKHVRWLPDQKQSRADYKGFLADRAELKAVLDALSAVSQSQFDRFSRPQQMAFLVNAYNAFTVELILTRYPDLKSIKELGSLLQSPWKRKFFRLLGEERHLDWVEHEMLRPNFAEPRIHTAVNCASIGCPALRNEAFTAGQLEAQLEDGMRRFMADRTRNRATAERAEINQIFRWFKEDFEQGHQGFKRVEDVLARYAEQLSDDPAVQARLRQGQVRIAHLEYDWSLNDLGR